MADTPLKLALDRLADMQTEALAGAGVTINAASYFPYFQDQPPYYWNWVRDYVLPQEIGAPDDIQTDIWIVEMGLVVAHSTEGFDGDLFENAYNWIPAVIDFFDDNTLLTSTNYPTPLNFLHPDDVRILAGGGIRQRRIAGIPTDQITFSLDLQLRILREVY